MIYVGSNLATSNMLEKADKNYKTDMIESTSAEKNDLSRGNKGKQSKSPNIKKNAIYSLISKLLITIIPVVTTPYLARVLGEVGNGQISYVSSIITYFTLAASLGFATYGQREIAKCRDDREQRSITFWEIFTTKVITTTVSLGVLAVLIFTIGFGERYNTLMLIMSLQVIAVIFDIEYLYTGNENFKSIAIRNIIVKVIGVALIFIFVRTADDVWIYALYLSLSTVFSYLIMWTGIKKYVGFVSIKKLKPWRHLKGTFIIFLPMVITSLFTTFDKTMIGMLSPNPDYDNGCYEQAYKINNIAQTFITIFSGVIMPRNVYAYNTGDIETMNNNVYKTCRYVWITSLFLVAGFMVLSENFCEWFLGAGYDEVPLLLYIMSIRLLVSGFSIIFGDRFIAMGKEKYWMISVLIGAITNIGINAILIPIWGAIGAAIATAACEVVILIIMSILTFRNNGLSFKNVFAPSWRYIIAAGEMFCVMFIMQQFMPYIVWSFFVIGLTGAALFAGMLLLLRDDFFIGLLRSVFGKVFAKFGRKDNNGRKDK